uniref:Uncharacterized protein n=1 Tax=Anguilla anguilla TaxID=7936 RepID=A0A0E9VT47_ANGAN
MVVCCVQGHIWLVINAVFEINMWVKAAVCTFKLSDQCLIYKCQSMW